MSIVLCSNHYHSYCSTIFLIFPSNLCIFFIYSDCEITHNKYLFFTVHHPSIITQNKALNCNVTVETYCDHIFLLTRPVGYTESCGPKVGNYAVELARLRGKMHSEVDLFTGGAFQRDTYVAATDCDVSDALGRYRHQLGQLP